MGVLLIHKPYHLGFMLSLNSYVPKERVLLLLTGSSYWTPKKVRNWHLIHLGMFSLLPDPEAWGLSRSDSRWTLNYSGTPIWVSHKIHIYIYIFP